MFIYFDGHEWFAACMYVHPMLSWCLQKPKEGTGSSGTGDTEAVSHIWMLETKAHQLQVQQVFFTAEPLLQPLKLIWKLDSS